ncbi:MAG: hypothetical protein MUC63_07530, partial [Planctomycetes bacterium]|nr:hypothetical protein [Planctomycetota bacterium]
AGQNVLEMDDTVGNERIHLQCPNKDSFLVLGKAPSGSAGGGGGGSGSGGGAPPSVDELIGADAPDSGPGAGGGPQASAPGPAPARGAGLAPAAWKGGAERPQAPPSPLRLVERPVEGKTPAASQLVSKATRGRPVVLDRGAAGARVVGPGPGSARPGSGLGALRIVGDPTSAPREWSRRAEGLRAASGWAGDGLPWAAKAARAPWDDSGSSAPPLPPAGFHEMTGLADIGGGISYTDPDSAAGGPYDLTIQVNKFTITATGASTKNKIDAPNGDLTLNAKNKIEITCTEKWDKSEGDENKIVGGNKVEVGRGTKTGVFAGVNTDVFGGMKNSLTVGNDFSIFVGFKESFNASGELQVSASGVCGITAVNDTHLSTTENRATAKSTKVSGQIDQVAGAIMNLTAGAAMNVTATGALMIKGAAAVTIDAVGVLSLKAAAAASITATAVTVTAPSINLVGSGSIVLTAGASVLTLNPAGLTVVAPLVTFT